MGKAEQYGLVLAGGGAKGAYEIGALLAIREFDLIDRIKVVAGNSIGSVNLTLFAQNDLDNAKKIWENISPDDFIELDGNGFDITKEGDGIFSREGLLNIIKTNVDLNRISDSDITYYITVCTKLSDGSVVPRYIKLNGKDPDVIAQYIMASSAIPVVYDAVCVEGVSYFDGGLCDNTPIRPVYNEGIKDIIVISNDSNYKSEQFYFTNANLINIIPSHSLDLDAVIATVDLSIARAKYRLKLGYLDAKSIINAHLAGVPVHDLSHNHNIAMQDMNKEKLEGSYNSNLDGLARILGSRDFLN